MGDSLSSKKTTFSVQEPYRAKSMQPSDIETNILGQQFIGLRNRASRASMANKNTNIAKKSMALQSTMQQAKKTVMMNPVTGELQSVDVKEEDDDALLSNLVENPQELMILMAFLKTRINVQSGFCKKIEESVFLVLMRFWGLIIGLANLSGGLENSILSTTTNSLGLSDSTLYEVNI